MIGLILIGALVVLPGVLYLALCLFVRRERAWATRLLILTGSLHLLISLFCNFLVLTDTRASRAAALTVALVAALLMGYLWCLLRCLGISKARQVHLRGFEPVMGSPRIATSTGVQ